MGAKKLQYLRDEKGKKIGVFLSISEYNKLLEQLEELEDIKAYDEAKETNEEFIPLGQAIKEIEDQRNDI